VSLWKTRHNSLEILAKDFKPQSIALVESFQVIDECIYEFESHSENDLYLRTCGVVLIKARNLALGIYSLMLDGLGQEAGALMRPFIEYHELLTYFRLDPNRVQEAYNQKLPSAGKRAQIIDGYFKDFREHLNEHASHSSFSDYSIKHIFNLNDLSLKATQPLYPKTLFRNLGDLYVQIALLLFESGYCLDDRATDGLVRKIEDIRTNGFKVFRLDERSE
jgi:hypothetical protein